MSLFDALDLYQDDTPRMAALNMAVDEALLEHSGRPAIRFYRWDHPALSFGYFGKFTDVAEHSDRDLVRRWTGGGIVLHGEDLTYSIVIPASDPVFAESAMSIYEKVHGSLRNALAGAGAQAELATVAADGSRSINMEACFANPVRADVMMSGRKVAGAAQRRTRRGLLQQGSIQHVDLARDFPERFARELSTVCKAQHLAEPTLGRANEIAEQRYGTPEWLRRR